MFVVNYISLSIHCSNFRNSYSTLRNSTRVLQQWRHELPWRIIDVRQDQCIQPMRDLGYKMASSFDMLLDFSQPMFEDFDDLKKTRIGKFLLPSLHEHT